MMSFQPSINIMYDIGKVQLFENYVPNINQLEIMNSILTDATKSEQHAHLLVGPYGAGKSLVGTMIATLITSSSINKKVYNQFFDSVYKASPDFETSMREAIAQNKQQWIPITITGKSGSFEQIILDSIQKKLMELDIPITLKSDASYINHLMQLWENSHPEVLTNLDSVVKKHGVDPREFKESLIEGNEQALIIFKNVYSEIAFGMPYHNPEKISFTEQLEHIFALLAKKKMGIFIVFDEFGRFLQTIPNSKIYETMQQIQDIAELVNRQKNAFVLMITHSGLQQYVNENTSLTKSELERVEKRFYEHRLESDSAIFYRSAHKLLKKKSQEVNIFLAQSLEKLKYEILKYDLFPEMTSEEINGFILEGCHPIHPLSIQILPSVSNLLGQNDRTLYLFLNKFKANDYEDIWYYADQLFDYFYPDESVLFTLDYMKYYRLAINYKVSETAIRIVKLGTLLNLLNNRYELTEQFIQFALGIDEVVAKQAMEELKDVKLLRFNPFVDSYELYEGAVVVFENVFKYVEGKVVLNNDLRIDAIQEIFGEKYHLPLGYNTAKSMTRYIETQFAFANQSWDINSTNDGTLFYIFTSNLSEQAKVKEQVQAYLKNDVLFGVIDLEMQRLLEYVNEYVLLKSMLNMPEIFNEHANLKKEILIRIDTAAYRIQKYLQPVKEFNVEVVKFYTHGEQIQISNANDFTKYIDYWMFTRFPSTPEIRNESFNKRSVMKIQRKSAIEILNQILQPSFNGDFELSGYGPDYLIYATTFKNLRFNFDDLDNQETPELGILREKLVSHLEAADRNSIYSLFSIALQEPFGIREPLVPLLVVPLIKDKWNQMAFYSNDFSITAITGEMIFEIIEQNVEFYEYEIYQLSVEQQELLKTLNEQFFEDDKALHPNHLFKKLNQWLLRLPRFTQVTNRQSEQIQMFKSILRASETDPLGASKKLVAMKLTASDIRLIKLELESFTGKFKTQIHKETLKLFDVEEVEQISEQHIKAIQSSPQLQEIISLYKTSHAIDGVISKVVGIKLEDWSDVTYDSYFTTLNQYLTVSLTEEIRLVDGSQVITTIQEMDLSVKGKTIYNQLQRIVDAGGRTMNPEEVKYILYRILQKID